MLIDFGRHDNLQSFDYFFWTFLTILFFYTCELFYLHFASISVEYR